MNKLINLKYIDYPVNVLGMVIPKSALCPNEITVLLCADIHVNYKTCKSQNISTHMLPFDVFVKTLMAETSGEIDFFIEGELHKAIEKRYNKKYGYVDDKIGLTTILNSFIKYMNSYPKILINKSKVHYIDIRNNFYALGKIFYKFNFDYVKAYNYILQDKSDVIGFKKLNKQIITANAAVQKALITFLYDAGNEIYKNHINTYNLSLKNDEHYIILAPLLKEKYNFTSLDYLLVIKYSVVLMDIYSFARMLKPQLNIKKAIFYTGYNHTLNTALFFTQYLKASVIYGDLSEFKTTLDIIKTKISKSNSDINQCHKIITDDWYKTLRRFL